MEVCVLDGSKLYQLLRAYCRERESLSPIVEAVRRFDGLLFTSELTLQRVVRRISEKETIEEEVVRETAKTALEFLKVRPVEVSVNFYSVPNLDEDDASILLLAIKLRETFPNSKVAIYSHDKDFWQPEVIELLKDFDITLKRAF